jgi:DNA repair protein RadA/Sms
LPIDEVAEAAGTIGYELMCALAPRAGGRGLSAWRRQNQYTCSECGGTATKWTGQCVLPAVEHHGGNRGRGGRQQPLLAAGPPVAGADGAGAVAADIDAIDVPRFGTGIEEFDRVLGGGLVAGGVVLIGGDPGIGKSTLLLQALANVSHMKKVLYVSGEESARRSPARQAPGDRCPRSETAGRNPA